MPEAGSAPLESGHGPLFRTLGECPWPGGILEQVVGGAEQLQHLLRVLFPIGGGVKQTAGSDDPSQQPHESGRQDASLAMPSFWPGVGKKEIHPHEARPFESLFQDLDGVMAAEPQISEPAPFDFHQQMTHAWAMNLDAEVVSLGMACRHFGQSFTVPETDLQVDRPRIAEQRPEIHELTRFPVDAEARPQILESAFLSKGDPALAKHIATDGTLVGLLLVHFAGERRARCPPCAGFIDSLSDACAWNTLRRSPSIQKNIPSKGEEAEAKRFAGMRPAR